MLLDIAAAALAVYIAWKARNRVTGTTGAPFVLLQGVAFLALYSRFGVAVAAVCFALSLAISMDALFHVRAAIRGRRQPAPTAAADAAAEPAGLRKRGSVGYLPVP